MITTIRLTTVNTTDIFQKDQTWEQPYGVMVFTAAFLAANTVLSLVTNSLLIVIIYVSPNLKTPPNKQLVNICVNNLVLGFTMVLSTVTTIVPVASNDGMDVLSGIHICLTYHCFFQYWGAFASIGYYRSRLIRHSSMSLKNRKVIITRSLTCSWVVSVLVSLMVTFAFVENDSYACVTINPFKRRFLLCDGLKSNALNRVSIIVIVISVFLIGLMVIVTSYYGVFRALNIPGTFGKNRVMPSVSLNMPSDLEDIPNIVPRSYTPSVQDAEKSTYAVRTGDRAEAVVHYNKNDHILTFEDIIALENPILASNLRKQGNQKRQLQLSRSTASNASVKSKCPDFTDISPGADLQRYQNLKNTSALRNHFLKRDRISLSNATKNSIIMLVSFIVFSLPMFVCTVPNVMSSVKQNHRVLIILFCKITFCLNAPVYPLWYLIYNVHVRRCMVRMYEGFLVRVNVRK